MLLDKTKKLRIIILQYVSITWKQNSSLGSFYVILLAELTIRINIISLLLIARQGTKFSDIWVYITASSFNQKNNFENVVCSLRRYDISSHDIDYVEYVGPGLTWGRTLSACVISMWSNDIKCIHISKKKTST